MGVGGGHTSTWLLGCTTGAPRGRGTGDGVGGGPDPGLFTR